MKGNAAPADGLNSLFILVLADTGVTMNDIRNSCMVLQEKPILSLPQGKGTPRYYLPTGHDLSCARIDERTEFQEEA